MSVLQRDQRDQPHFTPAVRVGIGRVLDYVRVLGACPTSVCVRDTYRQRRKRCPWVPGPHGNIPQVSPHIPLFLLFIQRPRETMQKGDAFTVPPADAISAQNKWRAAAPGNEKCTPPSSAPRGLGTLSGLLGRRGPSSTKETMDSHVTGRRGGQTLMLLQPRGLRLRTRALALTVRLARPS